ncbi:retrovirus-related pol polyprotein from transposon TNT 1-94 [Tanacetum coccineum]|uniref:Retrovirus-related pol polyprotein from transposon TNT 1-94 n=1 Tax=Tanacetum coccineum TaxID=301880 RepID=A0ABQ5CK29_9ASTR
MATNEETYDQPLAMTTTNIFEVNHEDAYDSDVDEGPNAAVAFMANLSSTSATNSQVNEVHSNDNPIFDNVDYQLSQEMHQEEHLDSDAETEIDDNTIPYHQYLLDTEAQNVPTEVSADTSDKVSMIAILTDLQTQLDRHAKVNQEKCLEVETLKNELSQCKQEIYRLDTQKVKLDLEHKVRLEQALVIQRNKRPPRYRYPGLGYMAKRAQPVLYDADTLLHPAHHPVRIWDSEDVLVHQVVSMKKMSEKPGHVRPANGFYDKLNAMMFVPQKETVQERRICSANEIVVVNAVFPQFEGIIKERTTQKPDYVSEWCFDYAKQFVEQQLVPFYDHFKKHIQAANETFFKEIREFEQIFDELEAEYEQCVLDNKNLTIEKKNLLIKNDCLIAECLEKDICSIVLTSDIVVPPSSNCLCEDLRSACDREHTKVLELEAEVLKQQKMVIESEKRNSHLQKTHIDLQLKFQNYKQCIDTSSASNAIFEINKLRDQLQGKDTTIRNLDAQINIMKVLNVGSTEGSCDQQALETDRIQLKDTITSLRIQLDGLKVENSEPSTSGHQKCLSGMYNLGSKYIPPPKRANWDKPTPLPKKKQVTFVEPPRPSLKPTQKPVVHPNKQTNVCVPMSTVRHGSKGISAVQIVLWYLDSGCSRHMTGDRARLINFVEKFIGTVRFGNDEYVAIVGYGGSLEVAFRQHSCYIRNSDMVDLLKGSRTTNLYSISLNDMVSASPLGKKQGKFTSNKGQENTNTEVLHTLHMDLCGPMRTESINGKKYILVIVDDYTRFGYVASHIKTDSVQTVQNSNLSALQSGSQPFCTSKRPEPPSVSSLTRNR